MPKKNLNTNMDKKKAHRRNTHKQSPKLPYWFPYLILVLVTAVLYFQAATFNIVQCDDHEIILKDFDRIDKIENWSDELFKSYMHNSYYRPVINLSFMVNAQMTGKELTSYHITNIVIHAINACLIYFLLNLLGYKRLIALIGGLIYVVHPVFTNAVAWIVGRNDLFFALFTLTTFILLILYINKQNLWYLLLHFFAFLLALFSKETAVMLPILFIAYLTLIRKINFRQKQIILCISSWIVAVIIWYIFKSMADLGEPVFRTGIDVFLFNLAVIPEFIAKFFFPVHLSVLPTYSFFNTTAGIVIIALLLFLYFRSEKKRNTYLIFGIIWFLIIIIPGMFITLLNSHDWNEYLECRGYLAMFGLLLIVFELTSGLWENKKIIMLVISLVTIVVLGFTTYLESQNYKDPPSYYESAIEDDSERANFHNILGQLYVNNLFKMTNDKEYLHKAAGEFKKAIELRPHYSLYYRSLAAVYSNSNQHELAIKYITKALELDSAVNDGYNVLGKSYYFLEKKEQAIWALLKALAHSPEDQNIIFNLSGIYFDIMKPDSAIFYAKKSYKLNPDYKNQYEIYTLYNKWGGYYIQKGFNNTGLMILKEAVQLAPNRYAAYENLMNYYLLINQKPDSAAYFALKLIDRGRPISREKMEFLKPYLPK
ncbi:glycosyltransferase family 39 protein [Bacteroidota bacterium]